MATHKLVKQTSYESLYRQGTRTRKKSVSAYSELRNSIEYSFPKTGYDIKQFDAIPVKIILVVPSPPKTERDNQR